MSGKVVESASWTSVSVSRLTSGVIVNTGARASAAPCPGSAVLAVLAVWSGVRKVLGSRLSASWLELGSEDSSSGDRGRRME